MGLGLIGQTQAAKDHFKDTIMLNKDVEGSHPKKDKRVVNAFLHVCSSKTMHSIPIGM